MVAPVFYNLPLAKARLPGSQELWISPGDFLEAHLISKLLQPSTAKYSLVDKDALLFLYEAYIVAYLKVSFFDFFD